MVRGVAGQVEGTRERGHWPKALSLSAFKGRRGLGVSAISPVLNERRGPDSPVWWLVDRVSLALGLGSPQSPALRSQAPWERPLWGRSRVRVSPQEARRCEPRAVGHVEWLAEMRTLGRGSVSPRVLACEFFEYCLVLAWPCPFSSPE